MIRLGLCCKFSKEPIHFRTTTATYLKKLSTENNNAYKYLSEIIQHNIASLIATIHYCSANHIGSFRIGSDFLPVATHPDVKYTLDSLPEGNIIKNELIKIKILAKSKNIRLTFHPGQFVILNSPKAEVVRNAIKDLESHCILAELIGADVINIHLGGGYKDKFLAIKRFEENFQNLSAGVQKRLTLENDDKIYSPSEIIPICKKLHIPFVYDVHHHRCLPDNLSVEDATKKALETWNREPLFHLSSPVNGWTNPKTSYHHDFINPQDFPDCWKKLDNLTIDIEAKAKEIAIKKLYQQLRKAVSFF